MFRITEDPSSGTIVQCLAKNYKNDSILSVDMDKVHVNELVYTQPQQVRICYHKTDLLHVNGHDRIILVIFGQALYNAP